MKIRNTCVPVYPSEDGYEIELTAVLTEGEIGDVAVYIGYGTPEWVARHGDKLTSDKARFFFPWLEKGNYRK